MSISRPTIPFVVGTIVAAVLVSAVFSVIFGVGPAQTLGPAVAVVGLAYKYRSTSNGSEVGDEHQSVENEEEDEDTDTEDRQQTMQPEHEDIGETLDSGTAAKEPSPPERQSSLLRSNEQIIEKTEELLGDRVTFYDDGTIDIAADDLNLYSEMMLYVIAKRIAYEHCLEDTSEVTVEELRDRTWYNKIEVLVFLEVAGTRLKPPHRIPQIDYTEVSALSFETSLKKLPEAAQWAINEEQFGRYSAPMAVSNAKSELSKARGQYKNVTEDHDSGALPKSDDRYEYAKQRTLTACIDLAYYPVEFGEDRAWDQYTAYAEASLKYLAEGYPMKAKNCLDDMNRFWQWMNDTVNEKYGY